MSARTVFQIFVLVMGLVLCGRGLWLLFSPAQYQAVARLEINPDVEIDSDGNTYAPYQPYFLETELKTMCGDTVLSNVVQTLNLNAEWSQRYAKGGPLQTSETMELLKRHVAVGPEPNSKLVDIFVWDEDPNQAARIANTVAEAYRDYRIQQSRQQTDAAIEALSNNYLKEEAEITALQTRLEQMRKQLVPTNSAPTDAMVTEIYNAKQPSLDRLKEQIAATNSNPADAEQMARYDAYFQAKRELDSKEETQGLLKSRIESNKAEENKLDRAGALDRLARIVVPAAVPKAAGAPIRWHGIIWLLCGLGISRAGFRSLLSNRKPVKLKS